VLFKWEHRWEDRRRTVLRLVPEIEWPTLHDNWGDKLKTHIPGQINTLAAIMMESAGTNEMVIWSNRELRDFGIREKDCELLLKGGFDLELFEERSDVGKELMCSLA
jgi:hypothetical protein